MSFLQKKRGRPAKNRRREQGKKILKWAGGGFLLSLILGFVFFLWSFSSLLFFLPNSFDILGMGEKKTYLVTLHNEGELRPNLGFLTGFIFLEIDSGKVKMEFHDSYDIAAPEPEIPAPDIIDTRFSHDPLYQGWVFRDSNFSPRFSQNVKQFHEFLQYDNRYKNKKIDGVISLDLYAIENVVDALGGIEFEGKVLSSDNLFSVLETKAKTFDPHSESEWLRRKSSMKPLADSVLKKIFFSPSRWKTVSERLFRMGNEKHILFWFDDKKIQETVKERNWTGDMPKNLLLHFETVFFMGHNFTNLGGRKADRYIEKTFTSLFEVSSRGKISENLSLRIQHNGTRNLNSDTYLSYMRIFRPKGAVLTKFSGDFETPPQKITEKNKKSFPDFADDYEEFELFFDVNVSSEKIFTFELSYPTRIDSQGQEFFLFSQSGKVGESQSVVFQAKGDSSFSFVDSHLDSSIRGCGEVKYLENISQCVIEKGGDVSFRLIQKEDTRPPILEDIFTEDNGRILRLDFSEEIQDVFPAEVFIQEKLSGEKLEITNIQQDNKSLIFSLKTPLMPQKETGEKTFYLLHIDSLVDIIGNGVFPFRITVTNKNQ